MANQFNYIQGKSTSIALIDPDGDPTFFDTDDFEWKPDTKTVSHTGLNNVRSEMTAHLGASGSFTFTLSTTDIYDFFNARQSEYKATGAYRWSTMFAYLNYPDGTQQVLTFTNCALVMGESMMKADDPTHIKVTWTAQDVQGM